MRPGFCGCHRRIQQLSISLKSLAFGSQGTKTSYRDVAVTPKDYVIGALGVIFTVAGAIWIGINATALDWSRTMVVSPIVA